jgi:hypothetical protein
MMDRWDERVVFLCRSRVILTWRAGERNPALYVLSANSLCDRDLRSTLQPFMITRLVQPRRLAPSIPCGLNSPRSHLRVVDVADSPSCDGRRPADDQVRPGRTSTWNHRQHRPPHRAAIP